MTADEYEEREEKKRALTQPEFLSESREEFKTSRYNDQEINDEEEQS
jgi:hypothetical protein